MNRINPRIMGFLLILGGVCAALPFQKLASHPAPHSRSSNSESIEWRSNDFTLEVAAQARPLTGADDPLDRPKSPAFGSGNRAVINSRASLDNITQPPALAGDYESAAANAILSDRVIGNLEATPPVTNDGVPATTTSPLESVAITHEIVDGDTLEDLAEKHLGSRVRWTEIYNANPEILDNPEVLPVGVTIVILPRMRASDSENVLMADSLVPISNGDLLKFRSASE